MKNLCCTLLSFAGVLIAGAPVFAQYYSGPRVCEKVGDTTVVEEQDYIEYALERAGGWSYGVGWACPGKVYEVEYGVAVTKVLDTDSCWWGATDGQYTNEFFATDGQYFYHIRPAKAEAEPAPLPYGSPFAILELAYKEPGSLLYGTDYDTLYMINLSTGVATPIGAMLLSDDTYVGGFWAMDYHNGDKQQMYAISANTDHLYSVNTETGRVTPIGPTYTTDLYDIWYDRMGGQLYAVQDPTVGGNEHYTINSTTGAGTELPNSDFDVSLGGLGDLGVSVIPTLSEWGLVVMLLLVVAAGTIVIRRRRAAVA